MRYSSLTLPALLVAVALCPGPVLGQVFGPRSAILDNAGVVDAQSEAALNRYLLELQPKTGAQVRVLTIGSTGGRDIYDYASDVFRRQNQGKGLGDAKGSNNGLLIVVAVQDKKYRFHVGEGLEGPLPDLYCNSIAEKYFAPSFRAGDFAAGIVQGTVAAAQKIAKDAGVQLTGMPRMAAPQRSRGHRRRGGFSCFWPLMLLFLFCGGGVFGRRRSGHYRAWGGGGLLQGMMLGSLLGGMWGGGRRGWSGGSSLGGFGGGGFGGGGFGGGGGSFGGGGCSGGW